MITKNVYENLAEVEIIICNILSFSDILYIVKNNEKILILLWFIKMTQ